MREVLDRLREAETAIDTRLNDVYYLAPSLGRTASIDLLWKAKQALWWATLHTLNAAASCGACDPT